MSVERGMKHEIESFLRPLIGKPMWGSARAADMEMLAFSSPKRMRVPIETTSPLAQRVRATMAAAGRERTRRMRQSIGSATRAVGH